ncbi:MAG: alpha-L-arabinofuranosidase C-terminal domain-containing protein [Candidatus Pseudobacter hemicellulosilyticus]|uniref:non-reducing end alpha-L-arabinofuranosidase n=1 Tax=Candidatus Pseudobacter hemicellulosilyticus TaxID=3121375 RepID=A0AAJ5WR06_9BACT|nr:MAG: alpha-L-arabinofuranosidase C-terminal domain-containing protein [Pseudobacter sp.]
MKKKCLLVACLVLFLLNNGMAFRNDPVPDSVWLFSYVTEKDKGRSGLRFAWSRNQQQWWSIGQDYGFVRSDYGRWGSQKRMETPYLLPGPDGRWHCVWSLNAEDRQFAHASSADLIQWGRQSYPFLEKGSNCQNPVVAYDTISGGYHIRYKDSYGRTYQCTTTDLKNYSAATEIPASQYTDLSRTIILPNGQYRGQVYKVAYRQVQQLEAAYERVQYRNALFNEHSGQDPQRFAGLQTVNARIAVQPEQSRSISNLLLGIFFEDINYAADGGLYAELIQNRDFEYTPSDKEGHDPNWNSLHSWSLRGQQSTWRVDTVRPIHPNNPHYIVLETRATGASLVNSGFDGIVVRKGARYTLSLYARQTTGKSKLQVQLVSKTGKLLAQTVLSVNSGQWKKLSAELTASEEATDAELQLLPLTTGNLHLDMVSLFPGQTFRNRPNGLRADLAQTIADIRPKFVRFPGGCVAHGDGLENIYRWKNTIGPLEARKPQRNLWGYHQTAGLGYFEYFRFCEDIGAAPLPVIAAGVPCQNSAVGGGGQQGGIPLAAMDDYIQDILDLVEYANGDARTTWGRKRAEAGHPAPFNLQYIGIGNEDLITDVFEERFRLIYQVMKERHPEITVVGTVGPFYEGTDYEEGWALARELQLPMVDEHYYQTPGWFIHNQDFYDKYDRNGPKVYLGEYATFVQGRRCNIETALSEALYLTALERNGDIVRMSSYAPLLAKEGHTQWNPDLIYFNNAEVKPTVSYEVQKLFGQHAGDTYLPVRMELSSQQDAVQKRIAVSVVRDSAGKDLILKLVNMLPVAVSTTLDLGGITLTGEAGKKIVLQGQPSDNNARPVTTAFSLPADGQEILPPYSFTLIQLTTK